MKTTCRAVPRAPTTGPASAYAAFYPLCASCHATGERAPPNFLAGSAERVVASVKQCAPRIYARLAMWRVAPEAVNRLAHGLGGRNPGQIVAEVPGHRVVQLDLR